MPFVIPSITVPVNWNHSGSDIFQYYNGEPPVEKVEDYVLWLKKELETARRWLVIQRQNEKEEVETTS